jgi:hypothetical protein
VPKGSAVVVSEEVVGILLLVALGGIVILAGVAVVLGIKLGRLRRDYTAALDPSRREDLFQAVRRQVDDLQALRGDLQVVHDNTETLRDMLKDSLSRVAVVRYDAFEDMGGALSFSAALLDELGDGVIVSAINGRTETRTYAKAVRGGTSEHHLSDEEALAIEQALTTGQKGERVATGGRRRRRASA